MPTVVVPYRGPEGKSRLSLQPPALRAALVEAMLADVVDACRVVGPVFVVAPEQPPVADVIWVRDPGQGQGAAVEAGLTVAAAAGGAAPLLVVNADLPCATGRDLVTLAGSVPAGGLALVPARDGTTNALALAASELFAPLYGPGSAVRFAALTESNLVDARNLVDDVDTVDDLERVEPRLGPHTRGVIATLRTEAAA